MSRGYLGSAGGIIIADRRHLRRRLSHRVLVATLPCMSRVVKCFPLQAYGQWNDLRRDCRTYRPLTM